MLLVLRICRWLLAWQGAEIAVGLGARRHVDEGGMHQFVAAVSRCPCISLLLVYGIALLLSIILRHGSEGRRR